ncbi:hypothetical protein MHU86_24421 [Fragilaria crotonensis]|nr:hypothetical protein MHU86_24421 [Fragilaria crotonensis]
MSWLRLHHCHDCNGSGVYTFGDGYVKKLFMDDGQLVSIWRIGLRSTCHNGHARKTYRAQQCSDRMGPKMAPDVFSGEDAGTWPQAELAALYNCKLASATSAREGGRHYALGCHHFNMPPTCWILDPTCDPIIDVIIAIDDEGIVGPTDCPSHSACPNPHPRGWKMVRHHNNLQFSDPLWSSDL